MEFDLFSVLGLESDLFFVRTVEIERVRAEINLFEVSQSIDLVWCAGGGRNCLGFWMRIENRLVLV